MKLNTIQRKKFRVTGKLKKVASSDRLRLSISRSAKNISAQIIDDVKNITLVSCSSVEKDIRSMDKVNKTEISKIVAEKLAKKAQEKKISKIFFDRGIYKYHGRVKVLGKFEDAIQPMERAVELMPDDPIVNDHLGDVYWKVGRKREAKFQWRRAISFDPEEKELVRIRKKLEVGLDEVQAQEKKK